MSQRLGKSEKLKSRQVIERLFSEGKSAKNFPVKIIYIPIEDFEKSKAAFAVPKRNFKRAVTRNRIKRQMREAYRLHKHLLITTQQPPFALLFLYISKEKPQFAPLSSSIEALLKKIIV